MKKKHRNIFFIKSNNAFIAISISFKVFKNLCLNENDETLFLKNLQTLIQFGPG